MLKILLFVSVCVAVTNAATRYGVRNGSYIQDTVTSQHPAVSRRHCSQRCTAHGSCVAANYNISSSLCHLFTSVSLDLEKGVDESAALLSTGAGQLGLWPLNELHQGENLIQQKTDIALYGVSFTDVNNDANNAWSSPPVHFAGTGSSYGQFINVDDVKMSGDFAFIASVYLEQNIGMPLVEWHTGSNFATHIWVHGNKLYLNLIPVANAAHSTVLNLNQWYTLALSFDQTSSRISMWVDGQLQVKQLPVCSPDYRNPLYAYVNKRPGFTPSAGHITCMGLYDIEMSYEDMISSTRPFC